MEVPILDDRILPLLKGEFPNAPEEVLRQWLAPAVKRDGWPPHGLHWVGVLGKNEVSFWKKKEWHLEEIDLEVVGWDWDTRDAVSKLLIGFGTLEESPWVMFSSTREKQRIVRALRHLTLTGAFFEPVIVYAIDSDHEGYSAVDGLHRLAAWQLLRKYRDCEEFTTHASTEWGVQESKYSPFQKAWVARNIPSIPS